MQPVQVLHGLSTWSVSNAFNQAERAPAIVSLIIITLVVVLLDGVQAWRHQLVFHS
jgi:hypothetical protein